MICPANTFPHLPLDHCIPTSLDVFVFLEFTKLSLFFLMRFFFFKLINLFLTALGLHCCMRAFSSCGEQGLLFIAVSRLLIVVASLVAEHRL